MSRQTRIIKVLGVHADANEALLSSFFLFHGEVVKAIIKDHVGYIEFSDSAAAESALLFDRSNFVGQVINVQLCDEPMPEKEEASEEEFEQVEMPPKTVSPPKTAKKEVTTATAKAPEAEAPAPERVPDVSSRFECFRTVLAQPINDGGAVLGVTLLGLFSALALG